MNFNNYANTIMEVNGLKCSLNMPKVVKRVKNADGSEGTAGLPPYAPRSAFPVDEYPASPDSWMHGSGEASSYFVPIKPEHGMWLDLTANQQHTHHVAAVVSVQGVNPLTGQKADPMRLEQYKNKCPKHEVDFQQDRYCPECKFKWHPQNYICTNNGSAFWIDGFRTEDGTVRQYYFTEEECKGVASQILGDKRVFAIGIAFYLSKEPKPKTIYRGGYAFGATACMDALESIECLGSNIASTSASWNTAAPRRMKSRMLSARTASREVEATKADVEANQKMLEIGAGAKIRQKLAADPENLDFWQEEPAGLIYINYCDEETAIKIIEAGKRQDKADGFLGGLNLREDDNFVEEGPHDDLNYPADKNCWDPQTWKMSPQNIIPESGVE